jgi:hypothetical protein
VCPSLSTQKQLVAQNHGSIRGPEMPALAHKPTISDVRQVIIRHLIDNIGRPSISISEVSHAVRRMFPLCELTDWELGDLITRSAIDAGFVIELDAAGP